MCWYFRQTAYFQTIFPTFCPELGEENIREMSFDMFAYRELRDTVSDCKTRCDQIEKELLDKKNAESCRKKQSIDFYCSSMSFIAGTEDRLMRFRT